MKTSKTLIGILGGVAVGATLGILFAPDKGLNTRKTIIKKSTDVKDDLKGQMDSIIHSFIGKCNSFMNKGEELVEKANDKTNIENINKINKDLEY
jgi:gas vesicle protein